MKLTRVFFVFKYWRLNKRKRQTNECQTNFSCCAPRGSHILSLTHNHTHTHIHWEKLGLNLHTRAHTSNTQIHTCTLWRKYTGTPQYSVHHTVCICWLQSFYKVFAHSAVPTFFNLQASAERYGPPDFCSPWILYQNNYLLMLIHWLVNVV